MLPKEETRKFPDMDEQDFIKKVVKRMSKGTISIWKDNKGSIMRVTKGQRDSQKGGLDKWTR